MEHRLARAKAEGKMLARRVVEDDKVGAAKVAEARKLLTKDVGILKVARQVGLGMGTVARVKNEMDAASRARKTLWR